MVIYFSWSGNTKAYAEALAKNKGMAIFQLIEKAERKSISKMSFFKACMQGIMKSKIEITLMPDIKNFDEIYICTPVWASGAAPAVRYFLNKAQLKNKKINFIFTYGSTEPDVLKKNTLELIKDKGCIIGNMYAFKTKFKQQPDYKTIEDNIHNL